MRDDKDNLIIDLTFNAKPKMLKADFIHKFKIAAKEADETEYWLLLCKDSKNYPDIGGLLVDLQVISKVISKIVSSSKR